MDLERSPLISMKQRAFILRRIRDIREKQRPCLEKCLRFLLYGDQEEDRAAIDSGSSSEDEAPARRDPGSAVLRADKNLAEPRTSQGVFSANGTSSIAMWKIQLNMTSMWTRSTGLLLQSSAADRPQPASRDIHVAFHRVPCTGCQRSASTIPISGSTLRRSEASELCSTRSPAAVGGAEARR